MAGARSVIIGFPSSTYPDQVYERFVEIDLQQMTRLEPLPPSNGGNGQSGPAAS